MPTRKNQDPNAPGMVVGPAASQVTPQPPANTAGTKDIVRKHAERRMMTDGMIQAVAALTNVKKFEEYAKTLGEADKAFNEGRDAEAKDILVGIGVFIKSRDEYVNNFGDPKDRNRKDEKDVMPLLARYAMNLFTDYQQDKNDPHSSRRYMQRYMLYCALDKVFPAGLLVSEAERQNNPGKYSTPPANVTLPNSIQESAATFDKLTKQDAFKNFFATVDQLEKTAMGKRTFEAEVHAKGTYTNPEGGSAHTYHRQLTNGQLIRANLYHINQTALDQMTATGLQEKHFNVDGLTVKNPFYDLVFTNKTIHENKTFCVTMEKEASGRWVFYKTEINPENHQPIRKDNGRLNITKLDVRDEIYGNFDKKSDYSGMPMINAIETAIRTLDKNYDAALNPDAKANESNKEKPLGTVGDAAKNAAPGLSVTRQKPK